MRLKYLRDNKVLLIFTIIPIIVGAILYWMVSPDVYFVSNIDSLISIKRNFSILNYPMLQILRNHLFDALWSFSLCCTLLLILDSYMAAISTAVVFVSCMELLQIFAWCPGTFDTIDISVEVLSVVLAYVATRKHRREKRYEESGS